MQTRFRFLSNTRYCLRAAFGDRGLDVTLEGKPLFSWRGDLLRFSTRKGFELLPADHLCVGGYRSTVIFHQVVGREITPDSTAKKSESTGDSISSHPPFDTPTTL